MYLRVARIFLYISAYGAEALGSKFGKQYFLVDSVCRKFFGIDADCNFFLLYAESLEVAHFANRPEAVANLFRIGFKFARGALFRFNGQKHRRGVAKVVNYNHFQNASRQRCSFEQLQSVADFRPYGILVVYCRLKFHKHIYNSVFGNRVGAVLVDFLIGEQKALQRFCNLLFHFLSRGSWIYCCNNTLTDSELRKLILVKVRQTEYSKRNKSGAHNKYYAVVLHCRLYVIALLHFLNILLSSHSHSVRQSEPTKVRVV